MAELTDGELEDLRKKAEESTAMIEGPEPMNVVTTGGGMSTLDFLHRDVEVYERVQAA